MQVVVKPLGIRYEEAMIIRDLASELGKMARDMFPDADDRIVSLISVAHVCLDSLTTISGIGGGVSTDWPEDWEKGQVHEEQFARAYRLALRDVPQIIKCIHRDLHPRLGVTHEKAQRIREIANALGNLARDLFPRTDKRVYGLVFAAHACVEALLVIPGIGEAILPDSANSKVLDRYIEAAYRLARHEVFHILKLD